ncbi:hypothetical protein [Levilactobacillus lindianensis]|uniref:hypothetical protein n=1 Tax=Levilactobacillus lindianensis TaxID=2486018 RepID=UPI000F74A3D0|nr:hypothetical protein [Levilactobacillus lindianensis]
MKIHKFFKIVVLMMVSFVAVSVSTISAHASSWHKGTPKELRGTYQMKRTSDVQGFGAVFKIKKNSFVLSLSDWPLMINTKLKYKKLSAHTYRVVGRTKHNGYILAHKYESVWYRQGKKFMYAPYSDYKKDKVKAFKYLRKNPPIKTKHIKNLGPIIHM